MPTQKIISPKIIFKTLYTSCVKRIYRIVGGTPKTKTLKSPYGTAIGMNKDYVVHISDGQHLLVVLLQQVHGVLRHLVLCASQEERARVDSTRDPSRHHAHVCLVRTQICTWYVFEI